MLLNTHSYYSLRYGTISIEDLVKAAHACGYEALALTDINNSTGLYDFIMECEKYMIKPIVGVDIRNGNDRCYVALAMNREGFKEINEMLTIYSREKKQHPVIAPDWNHCFVVYPYPQAPKVLRDFEYIGVRSSELNSFKMSRWNSQQNRVVILQSVSVQSDQYYNVHVLLRAIDNNLLLSKLSSSDVALREDRMLTKKELLDRFSQFPEIINTTQQLSDQCSFLFDFNTRKNRKNFTDSKARDKELLSRLAYQGMEYRYGKDNKEAKRRIRKELKTINQLNFAGYYLITWDIIQFSKNKGLFHVGRGSGANSIVSYCLGITDICPIELNLYFERFLNPSRTSPPDFDIDWSWANRDDVLDYIFDKFGAEHVAFTGVVGKFKHRSIMRELGKVYGLAKEEIDLLSKNPPAHHPKQKIIQSIHQYGAAIAGFPNQRSMHSCGILVSEEPLTYYTALDMYPKGYQTAQFDMYTAETIKFDKLDILSQRGLGHISDTISLVKQNQNIEVNIHQINDFKHDPRLNKRLSSGQTLGCFYIESPAMRGLLRRLKCNDYPTLVAASSVIRPGVAKSGMMREYIFRHNNPSQFEYFHEVFKEHLEETYGVMVYQEDVIKIAHHFAGLNFADADILRRAMTGKKRLKDEFNQVKKKYFSNCMAKGYSEQLTNEVYRQIESFAGFSFCKAHSASYSVESYQSLYLKTYFPIEFMVGVINNFGGFYRTEVYVYEARMSGATIHCPCVNRSDIMTNVKGTDIYLGFIHLANINKDIQVNIVEERNSNGEYSGLEDFVNRINVGWETLQMLIYSGGFRYTKKTKARLILEGRLLLSKVISVSINRLFTIKAKKFELPDMPRNVFEDAFDELELLGFPVSCTPFDLLKTKYRGDVMVRDLNQYNKKTVRMVGYLISRKNVPTKQGNMNFGTWIDIEGQYFDTTHFVQCLRSYPFAGGGCYLLLGQVDVDFSFPSVVIEKMAKLPFVPDPRYIDDEKKKFDIHAHYKADYSGTNRAPYPQEQEIGLPRYKMR